VRPPSIKIEEGPGFYRKYAQAAVYRKYDQAGVYRKYARKKVQRAASPIGWREQGRAVYVRGKSGRAVLSVWRGGESPSAVYKRGEQGDGVVRWESSQAERPFLKA
jgi:hypothetical protein